MNARQIRAINEEYDRLEGIVTREITTTLWDRSSNRRRVAQCVVIDLGRRPAVTPYVMTAEDKELMALRGAEYPQRRQRSTEAPETLCKRLHEWLKRSGAATHHQVAQGISISEAQAKHLLTSNTHLFKPWKRIAGQSYFVAV